MFSFYLRKLKIKSSSISLAAPALIQIILLDYTLKNSLSKGIVNGSSRKNIAR